MRHSLTCLSSAPLTMRGNVGWNAAQLTPRSCPSSTCFTTASLVPNKSVCPVLLRWSSMLLGPGDTFFLRSPAPERIRSSECSFKIGNWQNTIGQVAVLAQVSPKLDEKIPCMNSTTIAFIIFRTQGNKPICQIRVWNGRGQSWFGCALTWDVPDTNRLVEWSRHDEILVRVELRAHDVMRVPGQHRHTAARLPIPHADRLVIRGAQDPRVLLQWTVMLWARESGITQFIDVRNSSFICCKSKIQKHRQITTLQRNFVWKWWLNALIQRSNNKKQSLTWWKVVVLM